jgi:hypothetical protein
MVSVNELEGNFSRWNNCQSSYTGGSERGIRLVASEHRLYDSK